MLNANITRELSMDEILQKIERNLKDDSGTEASSTIEVPRSAEIVNLTEAVRDRDAVPEASTVEEPSMPETEMPSRPTGSRRNEAAFSPAETLKNGTGEPLLSDPAATPIGDVRELGAGHSERPAQAVMGGAHTLEDVMRELLRPQLQSWLDARLPAIIERQVRAELARTFRVWTQSHQ